MDRTECSLENLDYWIAQAMDARQEARDLTARLERAHELLREIHTRANFGPTVLRG